MSATAKRPPPTCSRCGGTPAEMPEYVYCAAELSMDPDEYVRREEGTYNPESDRFACTPCYAEMGAPTAPPPRGWKAP